MLRTHFVTHDVSCAAKTGKHLLRTQNVSEQNQKHFLCPGHKICVRNKCCARGQTGKHLCRQQCVCNNVSSFARAFKAEVKRRTSQEPNRMLMKLDEGEQRVFLICIRFCSCEVQRLTWALGRLGQRSHMLLIYRVVSFSKLAPFSKCFPASLLNHMQGGFSKFLRRV